MNRTAIVAVAALTAVSTVAFAEKAASLLDVRTVYMTVEETNMAESCIPALTRTLKSKYIEAESAESADAELAISLEGVKSLTLGDAVKFKAELIGEAGRVLWKNSGKENSLLTKSLPCSDVAEEIIEEMHDETT